MSRQTLFLSFFFLLFFGKLTAQTKINFTSPDKNISVSFWLNDEGRAFYTISHKGDLVLKDSKLGLEAQDADFVKSMKLIGESNVVPVKDNYELFTGKKSKVTYTANQKIIHLQSKE